MQAGSTTVRVIQRSLAAFFACGAFLLPAQTVPHETPVPNGTLQSTIAKVDRYHSDLSTRVRMSALRLDDWLGGDTSPDNEEEQDSTLRVRLSLKLGRDKGIKVNPSLSGHISLPRLQKRVHLFADNLRRGTLPGADEDQTRDDELRAGVRLHLYKHLRSLLSWDAGLRFGPFPEPFTTLTASHKKPIGKWTLELIQQGYWQTGDGFGEVSEMDWNYPIRSNLLFRSITAATWAETTTGVEFEQTMRTTWIIEKDKRSAMLSASVFANKTGPFYMSKYRVLTSYTTSLYRPWLFIEIAPQVDFPKDEGYDFMPSVRVSLSAFFGKDP